MNMQQKQSVLAIHVGIALGYFGNYVYMPHLITYIGEHYSGTLAGFIIFLTFLGRLFASIVAGGISERYGRKQVLVITVLIEAFALLAYGFATNLFLLSGLATLVGVASGISFPALKATLSELPESLRPKAFSQFVFAQKVGTIAGAIVGMFFTEIAMTKLFTVVCIVFLGYALSVGKFLHIPQEQKIQNRKIALVHWQHPRDWEIWNVLGLFVTYTFFWFLYSQFLVGMPLHIKWLASSFPVTMPFWITGITMILLQRFVYKRMSSYFQEVHLMMLGMASFTASFLLLGLGKTIMWIILAAILFVIAEMLFVPAFDVWLSKGLAGRSADRAMGTQHFFRSAGNMFGTCLAGITFDVAKRFNMPGINWLFFATIACGCMIFIYKKMNETNASVTLEVKN